MSSSCVIAPRLLQAAISTDGSHWRMRLRDMTSQQDSLDSLIPGVEQVMERTAREVKESLNRIQAREKDFNHDLEDGAGQYRQEQDVRRLSPKQPANTGPQRTAGRSCSSPTKEAVAGTDFLTHRMVGLPGERMLPAKRVLRKTISTRTTAPALPVASDCAARLSNRSSRRTRRDTRR